MAQFVSFGETDSGLNLDQVIDWEDGNDVATWGGHTPGTCLYVFVAVAGGADGMMGCETRRFQGAKRLALLGYLRTHSTVLALPEEEASALVDDGASAF